MKVDTTLIVHSDLSNFERSEKNFQFYSLFIRDSIVIVSRVPTS